MEDAELHRVLAGGVEGFDPTPGARRVHVVAVFVALRAPDGEVGERPRQGRGEREDDRPRGPAEPAVAMEEHGAAEAAEVLEEGFRAAGTEGRIARGGAGEEGKPLPEVGGFDFGFRAGRQRGVGRRASGADAPEGAAEGIDVPAGRARAFRGRVAGSADDGRGFAHVRQEADVGEDRLAAEEEDVAGLDVAVDHVAALQFGEGAGHADADVHAFGKRERDFGIDDGGERAGAVGGGGGGKAGLVVGKVHRVEEGCAVVGEVQVAHGGQALDRRKARGRLDAAPLAGEARPGVRFFAEADPFDREPASGLAGEVNRAVGSRADGGEEFVAAGGCGGADGIRGAHGGRIEHCNGEKARRKRRNGESRAGVARRALLGEKGAGEKSLRGRIFFLRSAREEV